MKYLINVANPFLDSKETNSVKKTLSKKWISMGKTVENFEKKIAKYIGVKYCVAMNNGTSTLDALVKVFNLKKNDEVLVPTFNYISSANVVKYNHLKLKLSDVDFKTFNINNENIEKNISKKTKLIILADIKGLPIDYDLILKNKKTKNIPIISDSAEAFGSKYKGKCVGSQVLAHSFSFFANKNITTGEGGAITTNSYLIYKKLKIIRNQGQEGRYNHTMLGNNYRMTDIAASVGIEQLKKIKKIISKKNKIVDYYNKSFKNNRFIETPYLPTYVTQHSWYNYFIRVNSKVRNKLIKFLEKKGIETRVSFPPIHIQPFYKKNEKFNYYQFPNANKIYSEIIDLPIWAGLSVKKQKYIIDSINNFFD